MEEFNLFKFHSLKNKHVLDVNSVTVLFHLISFPPTGKETLNLSANHKKVLCTYLLSQPLLLKTD
jgi:hypothetical protein